MSLGNSASVGCVQHTSQQPALVRSTHPTELPVFVIKPRPGWRAIELAELWKYRELLYFLTWRDVKVRYKQTVLGVLWALIQPVMTMVVFTIFFGRLGGMQQHVEGDYSIFVFAGLLPWQFFSTAVAQSGQSLIASSNLISKVYFPRLLVPIAAVGSSLVDLTISFSVLLALMVWDGVAFSAQLLFVPLFVFGTLLAAAGVGTFLSALSVAYRDFRYVVPFLIQIWMFASPVVFPFSVIPEKWRMVYALNPMVGMLSGFRSAVLNEPFYCGPIVVSSLVIVVFAVVAAFYFRRVERRLADIV